MATLTCTYDTLLSRVVLSAASLPATGDVVVFETSTDNIHWRQVRGGAAVPIVSSAASVYDYEFSPGVGNYYRASVVDVDPPSFISAGIAAVAVGIAVTPALPAGYAEGDLLVIWASIRNSGTGTVVCPTGYVVMWQVGNVGLFGKRAGAAGSESVPTVNVIGGVTGASGSDVIAQMACFRNLDVVVASNAYQLNPALQNIPYPGLAAFEPTWGAALILGWKQTSWTSVATVTTEIGETVSTAGASAGLVWDYQLMVTNSVIVPVAVSSGAFVVTAGINAISYGATVALAMAPYVTRTTAAITPQMAATWLKFPAAPYLNRVVVLTDWEASERTSRTSTDPVVGRQPPAAVLDLHSPRAINVALWAENDDEIAGIDLALLAGNIVLLHIPPNVALKSMYAAIGTYTYERPAHLSHKAKFTVPLTEVAMPDLAIVGNELTWGTLITNWGAWSDVTTANATWTVLLAKRGNPVDVLVGRS